MLSFTLDALQFIPYSNINADESGQVKTITNFGHTVRHRVSSQAWKRNIRQMVREEFDLDWKLSSNGYTIAQKLTELLDEATLEDPLWKAFYKNAISDKTLLDEENVLGLFPQSVLFETAETLAAEWKENDFTKVKEAETAGKELFPRIKARLEEVLNQNHWFPVTFGSMAAKFKVKHKAAFALSDALGIWETEPEVDFFTAVRENGVGGQATHMNDRSRVSSVVYRHGTINVDEILEATTNDANTVTVEEVQNIVRSVINAFVRAFPSGQETSTAPVTLPFFVMVTVRNEGNPLNLSEAFLIPVTPADNDDMRVTAINRIADQIQAENVYYDKNSAPQRFSVNTLGQNIIGTENSNSFSELSDAVIRFIGNK